MTARVNPPHAQLGPLLFAAVCAFGTITIFGGLITLPFGSEPWLAGLFGLAIILPGFLIIELGWLWIQREVTFSDDHIVIRRWLDAIRGGHGHRISMDGTRASITLDNVRSLRIERDDAKVELTLGYWEPGSVRKLIDELRSRGVPFTHYWIGTYPPDVA